MFFATPSTKEHTVQRIATTVAVVALAALTLASIASAAYGRKTHVTLRPAAHAVAKAPARAPQKAASRAPQKAAQRWLLRVGHNHAAF